MEFEVYQVDAFCEDLFSGNPAAVCPLDKWLPDDLLQSIAAENNLAETAFFVQQEDHFMIRWFTPSVEVDLCGHATLAAAHVLFEHKKYEKEVIWFMSPRSGLLVVTKAGDFLKLDFPADVFLPIPVSCEMAEWFGSKPLEAFKGRTDYMLVFATQGDIENIGANLSVIAGLKEARGVIVTARGDSVDFVSRFFAPQSGIPEDPVTGSAHTTLTPYWSAKLGLKDLTALQLSSRKGYLKCRDAGKRIEISGKAKTFFEGTMYL